MQKLTAASWALKAHHCDLLSLIVVCCQLSQYPIRPCPARLDMIFGQPPEGEGCIPKP
jgi:hypothetical protein